MKPMGTPPARSRENDKALREAYAQRYIALLKPEGDLAVDKIKCCQCDEPYAYGKEFVACDCYSTHWCGRCFRDMASKILHGGQQNDTQRI